MKELWQIFGVPPEESARTAGVSDGEVSTVWDELWAAWCAAAGLVRDMQLWTYWDVGWGLCDVSEGWQEQWDLAAVLGDWQEGLAVLLGAGMPEWPAVAADAGMADSTAEDVRPAVWRQSAGDADNAAVSEWSRTVLADVGGGGRVYRAAEEPYFLMAGESVRSVDIGMGQVAVRSMAGAPGREFMLPVDGAGWESMNEWGTVLRWNVPAGEGAAPVWHSRADGWAVDTVTGDVALPGGNMSSTEVDIAELSRQVAEVLSDGLQSVLCSRSFCGEMV